MLNKTLNLRPINYYEINEELCFYMGSRVASDYPEIREGFVNELIQSEYITVCNHIVREDRDYYVMMTGNYKFNVKLSENYNFAITRIFSAKEFQAQKKYMYNQGVLLMILRGGVSIVADGYKHSSLARTSTDWGMSPSGLRELRDGIDEYFFSTERINNYKVDNKFYKEIIQPIKNFTHYEDLAEQLDAYRENYVNYDSFKFVKGSARKKTYCFYSSSFDPDNELYQPGNRVAIETNERINQDLNRKLKGIISDRIEDENSTAFIIDIIEQFDNDILVNNNGHIYLQVNDAQKRVRERVVQNIENGTVDSKYMYRLFGKKGRPDTDEDDAPGWDEFKEELSKLEHRPNASQMKAIERGIKTKDIQLVLGPPGTGKTTVIVNWVKYFIRHGKRVLVSSQNNSAVDNVLERVGRDKNARIIRIGDIEKIQDNCKQYAPEKQIKQTAENYQNKIEDNKQWIIHDLSAVDERLSFLDSVKPDYEKLVSSREALNKYSADLKTGYDHVNSAKAAVQRSYAEYWKTNLSKIHMEISMMSLSKKSGIEKILFKRATKKIENELNSVTNQLSLQADDLIKSVEDYNTQADMLYKLLHQQDYVVSKNDYREMLDKCGKYSFAIELDGPFTTNYLTTSGMIDPESDPIELIGEYKEKLLAVKEKLYKVKKALDDWEISIQNHRTEIVTDLLIQNANIVGATCIGINTRPKFSNLDFDVSIIDESGQIQIHNAIVPMTRAPKTLMLGDHLQIPPIANETVVKLCNDDGIKTKLLEESFFEYLFTRFEKLDENTPNLTRLDEQFRMPSNISDVISEWFYNGNYHARYDMSKWHPIIKGTNSPLVLISTSRENRRFEKAEQGGGYSNALEADISTRIIKSISSEAFKTSEDGEVSPQVGIISAYGKQVRLIRKKIKEAKLGYRPENISSIVASLDSFQGQERPLIIYSCTRSADPRKVPATRARVGFLKELRRLNVAFTRCQVQLVIIGDFDYLTSCEYERIDELTGEPIPNQSEKKFSEFIGKVVLQAQSGKGEIYDSSEFLKGLG